MDSGPSEERARPPVGDACTGREIPRALPRRSGRVGWGAIVAIALAGIGLTAVAAALPVLRWMGPPGAPADVQWIATFPEVLRETSGVAVSRRHEDLVWTHNDSGDGPFLYAVSPTGQFLGRVPVTNARARDWEDLALGPCPVSWAATRDCLYVGDVGDNLSRRPRSIVYVLGEPTPEEMVRGDSVEAHALRVVYEDGPHDTEALAVTPGGDVVLVTKGNDDGWVRVYRIGAAQVDARVGRREDVVVAPLPPLPFRAATRSGTVVTGGAFSPDGTVLAVRTYTEVFFYAWEEPPAGDEAWREVRPRCSVRGSGFTGEAVDFLPDGRLLLTSEAMAGGGTLHVARCP